MPVRDLKQMIHDFGMPECFGLDSMDDGEIYWFLRQTGRTEQKHRDERPKTLPDDVSRRCLRLGTACTLVSDSHRGAL